MFQLYATNVLKMHYCHCNVIEVGELYFIPPFSTVSPHIPICICYTLTLSPLEKCKVPSTHDIIHVINSSAL